MYVSTKNINGINTTNRVKTLFKVQNQPNVTRAKFADFLPFLVTVQTISTQGKYIATHKPSHRSSHADPCRIFDDVDEREEGERMEWLFREATV